MDNCITINGKDYHVGDKILIVDEIPEKEGIDEKHEQAFRSILGQYCTITRIYVKDNRFYVKELEEAEDDDPGYAYYLTPLFVPEIEYIRSTDIEPLNMSGFFVFNKEVTVDA